MEEQLHEMDSSQDKLAQDMESIRANCQKLTASLYTIEPQIIYAEDSKKRVSVFVSAPKCQDTVLRSTVDVRRQKNVR